MSSRRCRERCHWSQTCKRNCREETRLHVQALSSSASQALMAAPNVMGLAFQRHVLNNIQQPQRPASTSITTHQSLSDRTDKLLGCMADTAFHRTSTSRFVEATIGNQPVSFCTARGLCHCLPFSHALMHELHKTMSNSMVEQRPSIRFGALA